MEKSWFLDRYKKLGGEYKELALPVTLRVNTLRTTAAELVPRLEKRGAVLKKIPYTQNGYEVITTPFSLGSCEEYLLGYYYIQSAAAQIPAEILAPQRGETILDLCASPGGKTTQMAALMNNEGALVCVEKKKERLARLKNNLERLFARNCLVYHMDGRNAKDLGTQFDKVLVDAPCSGNYVQEDGWFAKRKIEDIQEIAKVQRELLRAALSVTKQGGAIVYSTCSLEPEENELVIDWFIKTFKVTLEETGISAGEPALTTVFGQKLSSDLAKARRFWPARTATEGFFVAKLRKT